MEGVAEMVSDGTEKEKRGRPKKKPGYSKTEEIDKLLKTAVTPFVEPYDDRKHRSEDAPTILDVANAMNTTPLKVRKLLITAGFYSTQLSRKIQSLHADGFSLQEIMAKTALKKASVHGYLPYSKGAYLLTNPTLRAEQRCLFRMRKRACKRLNECATDQNLWIAIEAFAGYPFKAPDGSSLKYQVDGDELVFLNQDIRITKSEVMDAFHHHTNPFLTPIFLRICAV